ncbi:alpha/beta fold hydrolase [Parasedimentitalea marina]|uniref:Alpha/beta fold hydrolase n=1 Tax=Parasedimentitalea marina TaxID=2483033 RepID=A0A3T0N7S2_9RHOB|nr:alpha/beta fold hydrolase [Parasedimentitalea marina]AZV80078.1 alpha/beta fold hydrolase [Parasedimentitalea marina]
MRLLFRTVLGISLTVIASCSDRAFSPIVPEALDIGTPKSIFAATVREPLPDGNFGPSRSDHYSLLELTVSIPPNHQPGQLDFAYANPDPETQFTLAGRRVFDDPADFNARLKEDVAHLPRDEREVTLFVHGFNSTQTETAFRAAQLAKDIQLPGATMIYSWPSQGNPLGYAYDEDSVLFARDGLEHMLRKTRSAGVGRVALIAHSMGSLLVMETLRQIEIKTPGWSAANLSGVVLMSPDLDVQVFRSQMDRIDDVPQPFIVFVSSKDKLLNISNRLRGKHTSVRLGSLTSVEAVSGLPISIIDTTEFSDDAVSGHLVAGTSPALIAILNSARKTADAFGRETASFKTILPGQVTQSNGATQVSLRNATSDER